MHSTEELRRNIILKTREKIKNSLSKEDQQICKAIVILDEIDNSFNNFSELIIEWYSTYFPELLRFNLDNEHFLEFASQLKEKNNFKEEIIVKLLNDKEKAAKIANAAKNSVGANIPKESLEEIADISTILLKLKNERKKVESLLETILNKIAPNFSKIAGTIIAARLLAKAGSLKSLAFMSESSIQLLGAEKALILFKKTGKKFGPPKYGYLYAHPLVQALPKHSGGAMARTIASKLSIAAKADFFGKRQLDFSGYLQNRFQMLKNKKPKRATFRKYKKFKNFQKFKRR